MYVHTFPDVRLPVCFSSQCVTKCLIRKVMGLILPPPSRSSFKSVCDFSSLGVFLSCLLFLPPSPFILPFFLPSMMVSVYNQTAGFLSTRWLYSLGGGHSLVFQFHFSHSPLLFRFSISALLSFFSSFQHLPLPSPPSVTAALEGMSFHGRFAAISKMAALPNGQLPWF